MKQFTFLLIFVLSGLLLSCERETEDRSLNEDLQAVDMNGQWEVAAFNDSVSLSESFRLITRIESTSEIDSLIISDTGNKFWEFRTKAGVNAENASFATEGSICEVRDEGIGVIITNGRFINSDSIYFEIQFEDDETPYGNIYRIQGHRIL